MGEQTSTVLTHEQREAEAREYVSQHYPDLDPKQGQYWAVVDRVTGGKPVGDLEKLVVTAQDGARAQTFREQLRAASLRQTPVLPSRLTRELPSDTPDSAVFDKNGIPWLTEVRHREGGNIPAVKKGNLSIGGLLEYAVGEGDNPAYKPGTKIYGTVQNVEEGKIMVETILPPATLGRTESPDTILMNGTKVPFRALADKDFFPPTAEAVKPLLAK